MARLNEKQKLLVVAGTTLLLGGVAGGGIWWAEGEVERVSEEIAAMRQAIEAAEVKIRRIPDLEKDVIVLRETLQEQVKILPEKKEVLNFLLTTHQFVAQSGVQLQEFVDGRTGGRGKGSRFESYSYHLRLDATLWQLMKFISAFESYERFVNVKTIDVTAGADTRRDAQTGDVVHGVKMVVETYFYLGSKKGEDVDIKNYRNKREALQAQIWERLQSNTRETYEYRGRRDRRDILVDPRERPNERGAAGDLTLREQKEIVDRFVARVDGIGELVARIKDPRVTMFERTNLEREFKERDEATETDARAVLRDKKVSADAMRLRFQKHVLARLQELRTEVFGRKDTGDDAGQFLTAEELDNVQRQMTSALADGDYARARTEFDKQVSKLGVPESDLRHEKVMQLRELDKLAEVAIEFSELDLQIDGVVVNHDGASAVLLNRRVVQEGEYVRDELLVRRVDRERVEFVYKGFLLSLNHD